MTRGPHRVLGDPGAGGEVQDRFHQGLALEQTAAIGRRGGTLDGFPDGQTGLRAALVDRLLTGAAQVDGAVDRPGHRLRAPRAPNPADRR